MIDWYLGHTYYRLHQYIKAAKHVEIFISKKEDILNLNFLGKFILNKENMIRQCLFLRRLYC